MSYETLRYEERGRVAVITYDRQERRNAWNPPMYREAVAAIERANASADVGAIVITHDGPVFCAGTDFKAEPEPPDPQTGRRPNVATLSMAQDASWLHLLARSKPTIGAIRGAAIGLGVTQILPFDIRIGGASSTYSFPFLSLGLMPELGCTALLPRLVGYGHAVDICLSSAKLSAQEALDIGLITRVAGDDDVVAEAVALGEKLAAAPALQMQLTRELLRENSGEHDANVVLARETEAFVTMFRAAKEAKKKAAAEGA
ncbi:enoyl-CoA hydratase/carnithine racemase [Phenylobacterium zucineum HLK1]|uniref:Enoyl-CoA hydratase/carnithine racemase n=1 Tax=Phenylobacterium zucineum (strain HLK1) TaxID=450851 RepID=B4RGN2_PHEZH|nr:enoyl-CoA hydratase/isomerase family protein [Phenylobacterium zucineum]ACG78938.1 enoyl-CoA hydratase/carnithine racemase [Phenylobacterium zucineum HLK1]